MQMTPARVHKLLRQAQSQESASRIAEVPQQGSKAISIRHLSSTPREWLPCLKMTSHGDSLEYDVLLYKRALAGKVHRDKGVSKCDGILTLCHSTGRASLRNSSDADEAEVDSEREEDDDESKRTKLSWNKRRSLQHSKQTTRVSERRIVFSGVSRDLIQRTVVNDDIIALGAFDVQIIGLRRQSVAKEASTTIDIDATHGKQEATPLATLDRTKVTMMQFKPKFQGARIARLNPSQMIGSNKRRVDSTIPMSLSARKLPLQPIHIASSLNTATKGPLPVIPQKKRKLLVSKSSVCKSVTVAAKMPTNVAGVQRNVVLPHIPLPGSIRDVLRPHQIECVDFLWRTLDEKKGCILGDEMGLGKTLMTIACLTALHRRYREKQFVVVCPASLVANWAFEFDKWLGKASQPKRVVIHKGGQEGLSQIRSYTLKMKKQLKHQPGQVLIVSYELFRRNVGEFVVPDGISVGLLVVDEAHRLKSTTGTTQTLAALDSLSADARLCITATPIQNNLCEFYSLANFVCPGILGTDVSSFRKHFERPIAAANQKNATVEQLATGRASSQELEDIAKTFMLRRLQKDILSTMLPPRTETLLFCRPSAHQCQLYHMYTQNKVAGNDGMADALTTLTSLRRICCHPFCHDGKFVGGASGAASNNDLTLSGKLVVLNSLLNHIRQHAPNDKVVIVSNFTSALSIIESLIMMPRHFTFQRLDGTTKDRQSVVDTFNRTSAELNFCFLISSKAGGCGLNIVGANRLIMFDADWNPSSDVQAMGRIYRQGQTKPCTIYRLFTTGTVEEIIYQRQSQKGGLSTMTVDARTKKGKESAPSCESIMKFTKEELLDCFTLKGNCVCDTKNKVGKRWPDCDGSRACLLEMGCTDEPLLSLAESGSSSLSYIHIVNDQAIYETGNDDDDQAIYETGNDDDECIGSLPYVFNDESVDEDSENEFD